MRISYILAVAAGILFVFFVVVVVVVVVSGCKLRPDSKLDLNEREMVVDASVSCPDRITPASQAVKYVRRAVPSTVTFQSQEYHFS